MKLKMEKANIAVLGLGYVGCVTSAGLASLGHRVLGIDRAPHKVREVENGRVPFYEPGLEDLVRENNHALLEQLIGKGREVQVFDPGRVLTESLDQILGWEDHLTLDQRWASATADRIRESGIPVLGLVNGCFESGPPDHAVYAVN
jgi:hypothetical protein